MDHTAYLRTLLPSAPQALVVDDSDPTRRIFRNLLEEFGFQVEEARNGKEALSQIEKRIDELHLIFSDISMPIMDGFELCYRLQQEEWYDGTPFVLVSTESDANNVIRGLKLGADDFMPKPFDKEMTAQVIGRVMQNV
jgi:putative two-component system response regulator